jgi:signal transduction histidine kinase
MFSNFLSKKVIFKNYSIGKCFSFFVDFILVIAVILYCWLSWNSYSKDSLVYLDSQANRVDIYFDDIMERNAFFISYLAHYVKNIDYSDLDQISKLLAFSEDNNKSSRVIFWADKDLKAVVDNRGKMSIPADVSDRVYAQLSKANPNKIYFGKVVSNKVTHQLVIPAAMGALNKKQEYIGSVILAYEISKIKEKLRILTYKDVEFALFDKDLDLVLSSEDFVISEKMSDKIQHLDSNQKFGQLIEFSPFESYGESPSVYRRMDSFPYLIAIQFGRHYFRDKILDGIATSFIEILIILIVVGLIFYIIRRIFVNPVIRLSSAIESISKDEDKNIVFPTTKIKEINNLIYQINQIRDYKERLKDIDKSKRAFFANMSHELKTPLNGIMGFCKMLKADMYGEVTKEAKETLDLMFLSAQNLLSLINDLLDFSNMNIGKIEIKEKKFNIDHKIRESIQLLSLSAESSNIRIIYNSKLDSQIIFADPRMIKQLLLNIISNAIKFSNFGGKVKISLKIIEDGLEISVRDYGIGSKADLSDIVINDGYSRTSNRQGSGMGLVLAKKIADLHQAKILINDKIEKGFEIKFILPKSRIL